MPGGYLHPERGPWEENQKFQRADEIPPLDLSNTRIWDKTPILDIWAAPSNPNPNRTRPRMHTKITFPPKEYSQPIVDRMNFDRSHEATATSIE